MKKSLLDKHLVGHLIGYAEGKPLVADSRGRVMMFEPVDHAAIHEFMDEAMISAFVTEDGTHSFVHSSLGTPVQLH